MTTNGNSKYILVIDDSTTNVILLQAVLHGKGYEIATALSVKEANTIINRKKPDLILLDLLMPRIDGFEFLKNLKNDMNTNNIPVIVVSALTDQDNVNRSMALGANDFIKKPVDIQNLVEIVDSIFSH